MTLLTNSLLPTECSVQHYQLGKTMKTVSAADANRHFSSLLRDVASGQVVTVLSRGKPVATIGPVLAKSDQHQAAKSGLLERLNRQPALGQRDWSRGELYES